MRSRLSFGQWTWWVGLGAAGGLFVRIVGYLSLLEAWFLVTLPLRLREVVSTCCLPGMRGFTLLWIGWMVGAVVADIANATPLPLAARGFSRAFFLGVVCLCLVPRWLAAPRRLEAFVAGTPIAHVIGLKYLRSGTYTINGAEIDAADLGWETWTNYFLLSLAMAAIARWWRWSPWACAVLAAVIGGVNLVMGSRSAGATQLVAAALMPFFMGRRVAQRGLGLGRIAAIIATFVAGAVAIAMLYGTLAAGGTLGEKALEKYERQRAAKGGLIVGGRAEFFVGLSAALDRPLLGHGSWPVDTGEALERAATRFGFEISDGRSRRDPHAQALIPTHSAVVGAWVEHGIMGGIFWLAMLALLLRNTPRAVRFLPESTGLVVFNAPAAVWALFFSPMPQRATSAILLVPLLMIQVRSRQGLPRVAPREEA
jgi:hypothetical protein